MMRRKTICILAIIAYAPHTLPIFDTIEQITEYALTLPESPNPSDHDLLKPDFTDVMNQQLPTLFAKTFDTLLHFFNLAPDRLWDINQSIALMKKVTNERVQQGYTKKHVIKIPYSTHTECIIWGDIQGAFHSLDRDLNVLVKKGYLDSNLRIIKPNTYMIFNGDAIDRSPYSLATLTVLMKLMEQNPQHAFYIQGNHETKAVWSNATLADELRIRTNTENTEVIPFADEVNAFFNTLPLAVYIPSKHTDNAPTFIRISHYDRIEMPVLNSAYFGSFLRKESDKISIFHLKDSSKKRDYVDISAIIEGQSRSTIYQQLDGLKMIASDLGATAWTQLSSPTYVYQKLYQFHYDAFTILDIPEYIDQATITLHNQDIRTMTGFKTRSFNLLTGALPPTTPSQPLPRINQNNTTPDKGNEIVIGSLTDFNNTSAITGRLLRLGMSVKFNQMNSEHGGVHGKRLRLVMLNDRYTPNLTFTQAQILLNDYKTNILLTPQGTPTLEVCLPLIKADKLLALFNWGGAQVFRDPKLTNCINYRTSYYNEARALIDYAVTNIYIKNFTFFYQDDSYGLSPLEGAREALKAHGITQWTEVPYRRNAIDLEASLVKKVEDSHPEAILFFSTITPSAALIRALGTPYLVNKYLLGITFLSDEFRYFLTEKGLPFIISRVVPNPETSTLEIAQEYRAHLAKYAPESTPAVDSFEAYINTCLLIDVMEKMTGEITKDKIIAAFENMKKYQFKGLTLTFDPKTRELATNTLVWVDTGDEWLEKIDKTTEQLPTKHTPPTDIQPYM
jgi:branched-chain amino acid transport system substrate-binding protein